jgi:WD40 repeat protein
VFIEKFKTLSNEEQRYILASLAKHFIQSNETGRLNLLLSNFHFLQQKVELLGPYALASDYQGIQEKSLLLIQDAIRLSAHLLLLHKQTSLESQLYGRLFQENEPVIKRLLIQVERSTRPWIRSITPCLPRSNNELIFTLAGHANNVTSILTVPNDQILLSGSRDGQIKLWDFAQGIELETISVHQAPITAMIYLYNDLVISGDENGDIIIWHLVQKHALHKMEVVHGAIKSLLALKILNGFVSLAGGTVAIWQLDNTIHLVEVIAQDTNITAIAKSQDEQFLITGDEKGCLTLWAIDTRKKILTWQVSSSRINDIVSIPNYEWIACITTNFSISIWSYQGKSIKTIPGIKHQIGNESSSLAISHNNHFLVSSFGPRNNFLRIINLPKNKEIKQIEAHSWPISDILITQDNTIPSPIRMN